MKFFITLFSFLFIKNTLGQDRINFDSLTHVLEHIHTSDQEPRLVLDSLQKIHSFNSPEIQQVLAAMSKQDSINIVAVAAILDKYGWLGQKETSPKANGALFLVVQHAELETQLKYLPLLKKAVDEQKAAPTQYALLLDRTNLGQGKFQVYGSQLLSDVNGSITFSPIADEPNVNKRRSAVGLESMEEYAKRFGIKYQLPKIDTLQSKSVLEIRLYHNRQPLNEVEVYLDDKYLGQTNSTGLLQKVIDKTLLKHKLIIKKQGYAPATHTFDDITKDIVQVTLALQKT